eukprot:gene27530-34262_t
MVWSLKWGKRSLAAVITREKEPSTPPPKVSYKGCLDAHRKGAVLKFSFEEAKALAEGATSPSSKDFAVHNKTMTDGKVYSGSTLEAPTGFGIFQWISGYQKKCFYVGEWLQKSSVLNKATHIVWFGYGVQKNFIDYYAGSWVDGEFQGRGKLINFDNITSYVGKWYKGKRHGTGVFKSRNNYKYDGEWVNNIRHGQGREMSAWGDEYQGEFKDGYFHGKGLMKYRDGQQYQGDFKYGQRFGQGVQTLPCDQVAAKG